MSGEKTNNRADAGRYLIYLMRCALNGQTPEPPEGCGWEEVYRLAARSKVEATAWRAAREIAGRIPEELRARWKKAADATLYRQLCFDVEREKVIAALRERGLAYLCLKGINICNYYPEPGMRYMCDNDILYGFVEPDGDGYRVRGNSEKEREATAIQARDAACALMRERGYRVDGLNKVHLSCRKKPLFNFELHRELFYSNRQYWEYYANPWARAKKGSADGEYRFSDEDEYIYVICHTHKHFANAGCGVRALADEYVLWREKQNMDWRYVEEQLRRIGVDDFEASLRRAAVHALSPEGKTDAEDDRIMDYMLRSGTYGTTKNRVESSIDRIQEKSGGSRASARRDYIKSRIWMAEQDMECGYPLFYRHKALRAFLPLYRVVRALIRNRGGIRAELKVVWKERNSAETDLGR